MKVTKENQLQEDNPFCVKFVWKQDFIEMSLINGEDLFKIASLMSDILTKNDIDHIIEKGKV